MAQTSLALLAARCRQMGYLAVAHPDLDRAVVNSTGSPVSWASVLDALRDVLLYRVGRDDVLVSLVDIVSDSHFVLGHEITTWSVIDLRTGVVAGHVARDDWNGLDNLLVTVARHSGS
jgi:hypothetical protein